MANTGWVASEVMPSKVNVYSNGDWFDIPNPWTTDAPGVLGYRMDGWDIGGDVDVIMDGLVVAGTHTEGYRGFCGTCFCPQGVQVQHSARGGSTVWWRYWRMHR